MGQARQKSVEYFTYGDYVHWSDGGRWELIDGVAHAMAPAPSVVHQSVTFALARQIAEALEGAPCRVLLSPIDVRLPHKDETDEQVDTVVQPDLLVVCDMSKIDARGIRGAPDWVIEVLSPTTASHDQIVKRDLYERTGVKEYWLVHPVDHILMVYCLENGRYGRPEVFAMRGTTAALTFSGVSIDWSRVIDPSLPLGT